MKKLTLFTALCCIVVLSAFFDIHNLPPSFIGCACAQHPDGTGNGPKAVFVPISGLPENVGYTTNPNPMGTSLGKPWGFQINYFSAAWPSGIYYGLSTTQSVLNLDNNQPPNQNCTFGALTFDAGNIETNLSQGRLCFTGVQSYYCMNTSMAWVNKSCNVRMRVIVTLQNGITPVAFSVQSDKIVALTNQNFMVRVYMEVNTANLDNLVWVGPNYYNSGWRGVTDVFDALSTSTSRSVCTTFEIYNFYTGSPTIEVEPATNPTGTGIFTNPNPVNNALGTSQGLQVVYTNANWPKCVNWGLYKNQAVLNLNNTQPPNFNCSYGTLTYDPTSTETNLANGRVCFSGTQAYYCLNSSGAWIMKPVSVRMRMIVTQINGSTPIPLGVADDYILMHANKNFMVRVYMEANTSQLDNLLWGGPNYYNSGWRGVTDIYNSLHTDMNRSICTQFPLNNFLSLNTTVVASSNSPIQLGDALEFSGSSNINCCYHWYGPDSFNSTLQNPVIAVSEIPDFGTYELFITDNVVCYGYDETATMVLPSVFITPESGEVCSGGEFLLTATAVGTGCTFTYQWQYFYNGVWKNAAGFTSPTLMTNPPYTRSYRVVVNATNSTETVQVVSDPVTVTVYLDPSFAAQPVSGYVCSGGSHTLSVAVNNGIGNTYQWQSSADNVSWSDIQGANTSSYTATDVTVKTYYRCKVIATVSGCGTYMTSKVVAVYVYPDPTISISGTSAISPTGATTLVATLTPGYGTPGYQWQRYHNGDWENLPGEVSEQIHVSPSEETQYRCIVNYTTSGCDAAISNVITVEIDPNSVIVNTYGETTVCKGTCTEIGVDVQTIYLTTIDYQWYYWENETWKIAYMETSPALNACPPETRIYRCRIGTPGAPVTVSYSDPITVTVVPALIITVQPTGANICSGGSHTMSVEVSGGMQTQYQWQSSADLESWHDIPGANQTSYEAVNLLEMYYYRCKLTGTTDGCTGDIYSKTVYIRVYPDPTAVASGSTTICQGGSATLTTSITGGYGTVSYQWQYYGITKATGEWLNIPGANSASITLSPGESTDYRCLVNTNAPGCDEAVSNTQTVNVVSDPATTDITQSTQINPGESVLLSITVDGGQSLSYQWQYLLNSNWSGITGANTSTLLVSPAYTRTYRVRVSSTGEGCDSYFSEEITITVGSQSKNPETVEPGRETEPVLPETEEIEVNLYPNPFNEQLNLNLSHITDGDVVVELYDLTGNKINRWVFENQSGSFSQTLNLEHLAPAMYVVQIQNGGKITMRRAVKN